MAGTLTISTLSDGTNSTSSTNCIQGSAKAWVNFNGITTATVRASYNVSSVTRNATGQYTVNFTTPMVDANYTTVATANYYTVSYYDTAPTTSAVKLYAGAGPWTGTYNDSSYVMAAIFR